MFLTVFPGWALYGCAEIPARIAHPPSEDDLQLDKALANINENIDQSVRWGGTVLTVSKDNEEIWIEIQQRGLDQYGAPRQRNGSMGRFLVKTEQSPEDLQSLIGMDITVFGTLGGSYDGSIGHAPYLFPVVNAKEHYLWGTKYSAGYSRYYNDYFRYPHHYYFGSYRYPSLLYPHLYTSHHQLYGFYFRPRYRHGHYYYL